MNKQFDDLAEHFKDDRLATSVMLESHQRLIDLLLERIRVVENKLGELINVKIPHCPSHGDVEHAHRCHDFDDMPWQSRVKE